ncbi:hypothetical protein AAMO2058_001421700 [Amorphochlora amoebiformis]
MSHLISEKIAKVVIILRQGRSLTAIPAPEMAASSAQDYEVERILAWRKSNAGLDFFIKWKGYDNSWNTWEPEENISPELTRGIKESLSSSRANKRPYIAGDIDSQLHSSIEDVPFRQDGGRVKTEKLLAHAKRSLFGIVRVIQKMAASREDTESAQVVEKITKEIHELRDAYVDKEVELEEAQRENIELRARLEKSIRELKKGNILSKRYDRAVDRQVHRKLVHLQSRLDASLGKITELEAKVLALKTVASERWSKGEMILRSKATRPENSELKRVQRELQKSKTLAKHFKLTMFEEREALKKEIEKLRAQLSQTASENGRV